MPIFLSHISALEVIRRWDSFRLIERGFREEPLPVPSKMPSAPEIEQMCSVSPVLASISKPLHVLVADICGRHHCELVVPHLASSPIPTFAQFELAPGLTCSSPELIALQMTEYASDLELLLLVDVIMTEIISRDRKYLKRKNLSDSLTTDDILPDNLYFTP